MLLHYRYITVTLPLHLTIQEEQLRAYPRFTQMQAHVAAQP